MKMPNKKSAIIRIVIGIILAIVGLSLQLIIKSEEIISRTLSLTFALGCGLIGGGLGALYKIKSIENVPGQLKQIEIEYKDERNEFIRNKANAKAGDISNWFVIILAYICVIMGYPNWLIFFMVGIFCIKYILGVLLMNKYNKEF